MGHSTRFAAMSSPLARVDITKLEREPLTHVTPGRVNDHICIGMVKMLRWIADRAFRERYIHRATMLVSVASAAPAAGSVAAYLRMFFKNRLTSADGGSSVSTRTSTSAEVDSPFLPADRGAQASSSSSPSSFFGQASDRRLHRSTPNSPVSGAPLRHSYVDELRGLLAQSECHAVHYQILDSMAEVTVLERALVLMLQSFHFTFYLALFLFYPRMGFRLMAYTAEESSVVWTQMVNDVDLGKIAELRVPKLALHYWGLEGVFTAQGAPVPMVVAPQAQDVVLFKGGEKSAAEVVDSNGSDDSKSATSASVKLADAANLDKPFPSKAADGEAPETVSKSGSSAFAAADSAATASRSMGGEAEKEEPFVRNPTFDDPSERILTLRDVVLLIRSDEMVYRDLNHEMANELDAQPGFLRRIADKYV
ncbi:putative alternative oxidase [Leptomonas seymouri]|uniref:Alternative oxidase n=1 Tax=Leptomonas seymouri TaxID=5684 RepID=A0A0N0P770_LEPSE|nr:putative alternative oxidase [Leptomonas seymouri]|eukprot:KPI88449.1 putative alternative oxidase [Leptomonas seymouri]